MVEVIISVFVDVFFEIADFFADKVVKRFAAKKRKPK